MNKILEHFNVSSYYELQEYIKENPNDPKVKEFQEFLEYKREMEKKISEEQEKYI